MLDTINFSDVSEPTLSDLINSGVTEGANIEFKRDAVGNSDADKREFLKDVSAFANAAGGHLLIGMRAEEGAPVELTGLPGINPDAEVQRLDSMIRDNLEPRPLGIQVRAIPVRAGAAIVVRVPRSWNPPHRVSFKGWNKFFTRNSNGTHEVNVEELRRLFVVSSTLAEAVRNFRIERLAKIMANDTPVTVGPSGKVVVHVVPLISFGRDDAIDPNGVTSKGQEFAPIASSGHSLRVNMDGPLLTSGRSDEGLAQSYTQVFRNGVIETVRGDFLMERERHPKVVPWGDLDQQIFECVPRFVRGLAQLGIAPPYAVMLSLVDVRGAAILTESFYRDVTEADRDILVAPEVVINQAELTKNWHSLLRPSFDAIWQGFGHFRAQNFGPDGSWKPRR